MELLFLRLRGLGYVLLLEMDLTFLHYKRVLWMYQWHMDLSFMRFPGSKATFNMESSLMENKGDPCISNPHFLPPFSDTPFSSQPGATSNTWLGSLTSPGPLVCMHFTWPHFLSSSLLYVQRHLLFCLVLQPGTLPLHMLSAHLWPFSDGAWTP